MEGCGFKHLVTYNLKIINDLSGPCLEHEKRD